MALTKRTHRTVTLRQFIAALENDGYEQAFGVYFLNEYSDGYFAACAIGQASLNLGVDASSLHGALNSTMTATGMTVGSLVTDLNDNKKRSLASIASTLRSLFSADQMDSVTVKVDRADYSNIPSWRGVTVPLGAVQARS